MSTSVFIVHTNPVEGREREFNEWYTERHLADVVAIPGFTRARRYRLAKAQMSPLDDYRYCAIYEVEGDPEEALKALRAALADGMEVSGSKAERLHATMYEPITEWMEGVSFGQSSPEQLRT